MNSSFFVITDVESPLVRFLKKKGRYEIFDAKERCNCLAN